MPFELPRAAGHGLDPRRVISREARIIERIGADQADPQCIEDDRAAARAENEGYPLGRDSLAGCPTSEPVGRRADA